VPQTTVARTTVPSTTVARTSTTAATTTTTTTTAPRSVTYPQYAAAEGAGTITLAFVDGTSISLYGFAANGSWTYRAETNGPTTVKLKFYEPATGNDAEFTARVSGGRIQVEN